MNACIHTEDSHWRQLCSNAAAVSRPSTFCRRFQRVLPSIARGAPPLVWGGDARVRSRDNACREFPLPHRHPRVLLCVSHVVCACVCVCVCVCVFVCLFVCVCVRLHISTNVNICVRGRWYECARPTGCATYRASRVAHIWACNIYVYVCVCTAYMHVSDRACVCAYQMWARCIGPRETSFGTIMKNPRANFIRTRYTLELVLCQHGEHGA